MTVVVTGARERRGRALEVWITGGGTREPIDAVRWVGNVSTGRLAVELARAASRRGDRVTLFLAALATAPRSRRIHVERYVTTADLSARLRARARAGPPPDAILHAAAVSDYAPSPVRGKVASGRARWRLELRPLPKLVAELRRRHPRAVLCMFKLESEIGRAELIRRATAAARRAGADLVFANLLEEVGAEHRGFLIDPLGGTMNRGMGGNGGNGSNGGNGDADGTGAAGGARGGVIETTTRAAAARAILRACRARVARGAKA